MPRRPPSSGAALLAPILALLLGCASPPPRGTPLDTPPPPAPGRHILTGLAMPPEDGRGEDCAPASLWCLAHRAGLGTSPEEVQAAVTTTATGWTPVDLALAARRVGLPLVVRRLGIEDLRNLVLKGEPALLVLDLGRRDRPLRHVAVLAGADPVPGALYLLDRNGRLVRWPPADLARAYEAGGGLALVPPDAAAEAGGGNSGGATRLPEGEHTPEEWIWFGRGYASRQAWDLAIAAYGRALRARPEDPEALRGLGQAQRASGRLDAALRTYERLRKAEPGDEDIVRTIEAIRNTRAARGSGGEGEP